VGVVCRIQTDEGEVVIAPQSPDVEIVLSQDGRTIRVIDTKTQKRMTVPVGSYDVALKDKPEGFELKTEKITIARGREELVHIERVAQSRADRDRSGQTAASERDVRRDRKEQAGSSLRKIAEVRRIEWPEVHVHRVAFSPDGRLYAAGGTSNTVRVWEVASGKLLHEFVGHEEAIGGVAFTPDSKQLLSGAADATMRLWDVASGRPIRIWPGHSGLVVGVAVSPDGRWAVSGAHDQTLRLWELATGREVRKLEGHTDVSDGMFSADSKQVLSWSGDRSVRLWDVASGKQLHLYQGHTGWIWGAYFLDGEKRMVSWSGVDHTVRVWDIAREKEVRRHPLKRQKLEGLDVSPDGRTYLAAYTDQTVCLYDMATGKELAVTRAANVPDVLTISPDGHYAAAGSYRGLVHLWRLPDDPAAKSEP
jgi:WD40 repeat protein